MPSECPVCHVNAVETETGGEHVCHECGAVVESRVFNFENDSRDGWTQMNADGTAKFDGRYELSQAIRQRLPTSGNSKSTRLLQQSLYTLVKRMNLSVDLLNEARLFLLNIVQPRIRSKEITGLPKSRDILVASCVYIVCRQNSIPLNYRTMSQKAECNKFNLAKATKIILQALGIQLERLSLSELVTDVLSQFQVLDPSCDRLATDLLEICEDSDILSEHSKIMSATVLVMLTLDSLRLSPSKERLSEVLGKNALTEIQVRREMLHLMDNFSEFAKQVPWITKSVCRKNICRHLQDIVNFHKKCGKLDKNVVKSRGMKLREQLERRRGEKIKMAKARILNNSQGQQKLFSNGDNNNDALPCAGSCLKRTSSPNFVSGCDTRCDGEHDFQHAASATDTLSSYQTQENPTSVTSHESTRHNLGAEHSLLSDGHQSKKYTHSGAVVINADELHMRSDEGLDEHDILIENLLQSGYSEEELMDGYYESRMCELQSERQLDPKGEREELDETDIAEQDMHHYLFSVAEMKRLRNLKKA